MRESQARIVAGRCIKRATETRARLAILRRDDGACRVLLVEDAEHFIRQGRATWAQLVGVYDHWAHADDIVEDLMAAGTAACN